MKKLSWILIIIGSLFIINAIFGRYIVLPGYFQSLEAGISASTIPENIPIIKVLRYLLWAFSFKFGIFFILLGFITNATYKKYEKVIFLIIGLTYISIAYMEWPFNSSLYFGIGGSIITIASIVILYYINKNNINKQFKMLINYGYFFLIMAAYNLCPFFGVKCFGLEPEKMIKYSLQTTARSFANHIMSELIIGFVCIALFYYLNNKKREV